MAGDVSLPQGWSVQTIGSLGKVLTGKTPSTKVEGNFGGRVPFITPSDMDGRRIIRETARCLTQQGAGAVASARIPKDTVMVSCIGSDMGKAAIAGCDAVTNQQINSIVVGKGISHLYVYYNLSMRQSEIQHLGSGGSAVPILNKGHFCQLGIVLPPLKEQQAIACILGALDDKIELNRRMNQTLEAMARAIFKSWFVDFDPVRAKAAGKKPPGLKPDIAALFPDAFEESELGEIPKGWGCPRISTLVKERRDRIGEIDAPEYSSTNDGLQLRSERFKKTLAVSPSNNKRIQRGDLVFGLSRRVLNFGLMRDELGSVSFAYKVVSVEDSQVDPDYLERLMRIRSHYYYSAVSASSREGQSASLDSLGLLHVTVPPTDIFARFKQLDNLLASSRASVDAESRTLASLRDALLPKLISGELRVPDAERIVKGCV